MDAPLDIPSSVSSDHPTAAAAGDGPPAKWEQQYAQRGTGPLARLLFPLQVQHAYLRRLGAAFSYKYVLAVSSVYGISQGIGEGYYHFTFDFFAAQGAVRDDV